MKNGLSHNHKHRYNKQMRKLVPPEHDHSLIGTMRINPKTYKPLSNDTDFARTKYAVAGLLFMLRREQTIRNVLMTTIIVSILAAWLEIDGLHAVIVFLSLGLVWITETMNSAIEAVVDLVTQELHPLAKVAKDVAAAATLMATVTSASITLTLVGPPLIQKLGTIFGS